MKIKIILLAGLVSVGLTSCEDFLNIPPQNAVTPENFFQSESDFRQAVDGIYAPLQQLYNNESSWAMGEMRSDNTHYFYNVDYRLPYPEEIADFLNGSENDVTQHKYYINYDIINRANQVLNVIDEAELEQTTKNNFKGQALFLRALSYFDLVKYFGGVPLHLAPSRNMETAFLPRASAQEVYAQIQADATAAVDLLPNKANQQAGRATSGAALTLLGDVYLNLKEWDKAETVLKQIEGYGLLNDYSAIFNPTNKNHNESIFEVQYLEGTSLGLHSTFPYFFVPLTADHAQLTLGPSGSQSVPGSGWNIPTEDLLTAYEDEDQRYQASIGFHTGASPISDTSYVNLPYIKKYQHSHTIFGQSNQNFPVYRYAEVLLMLAEALNEQNKSAEAAEYLSQVRRRAGLSDTNVSGQTALRDAILQERRVELAFENKRWIDLVRTGKAIEVMNAYGSKLKANPAYYYLSSASYSLNEDHLLFPIPFLELQVNPDLQQNPGY